MPHFRPSGTSSPRPRTDLPEELRNLRQDDVELLESVIQRATPAATTFLTVFKAYNDVLLERGLDPNEVVYYTRLLKLGTMRGETWGEKWQAVKRTLRLPTPKPVAPSVTMHDSDFDDSFTDAPLHHYPTLQAEENDYEKAPTRDARFQPRRAQPQPPPSEDSDAATEYATPIAKSSRITHKNDSRARRNSVEPTSRTPRHVVQSAAETARQNLALAREKRGAGTLDPSSVWEKLAHENHLKEAEDHYDLTLMTRCFTLWRLNLEWLRTTQAQIDEARRSLDLRLYFERWKKRTAERKAFEVKVIGLVNGWVLKRALTKWKAVYTKRRQEKWRNEMREKLRAFRRESARRLLRTAYIQWSWALRGRLADRQCEHRLLQKSMVKWIAKFDSISVMEHKADEAHRRREALIAGEAWERWKKTTALVGIERTMSLRVDVRILEAMWMKWRKKTRDFELADVYYNNCLIGRTLKKWNVSRQRVTSLERRADRHLARSDDLLVRAVMRVWKARERSELFERTRVKRSLVRSWNTWKAKLQKLDQMEAKAAHFYQRPSNHLLRVSILRWHSITSAHLSTALHAESHYNAVLLRHSISQWLRHLARLRKHEELAILAEKQLSCRRALDKWRARKEDRDRWHKLGQLELMKKTKIFQGWLESVRKRRQMRESEELLRAVVDQRIMRNMLSRWTTRVVDIKLRELNVIEAREAKIVSNCFSIWRAAYHRQSDNMQLMESFLLVKREDTLRRVLDHWLTKTRAVKTLREKEKEHERNILINAWDRWRDRFADERLRHLEDTVMVMVQRGLMGRFLTKWRGNTKTLPAIRFDALHLKKRAWNRWRAVMPLAVKLKQAKDADRRFLMTRIMNKWVQAYQTKLTLKAVARARNLRLPAATPRYPRSTQVLVAPLPPTPVSAKPRIHSRRTPVEKQDTSSDEEEDEEDEPVKPSRVLPARNLVARSQPITARTTPSLSTFLNKRTTQNSLDAKPNPSRARSEVSPARSTRSRFSLARDPSPAHSAGVAGSSASRFGAERNRSPVKKAPFGIATPSPSGSTVATGPAEERQGRLWRELRHVRGRSRANSRNHSP